MARFGLDDSDDDDRSSGYSAGAASDSAASDDAAEYARRSPTSSSRSSTLDGADAKALSRRRTASSEDEDEYDEASEDEGRFSLSGEDEDEVLQDQDEDDGAPPRASLLTDDESMDEQDASGLLPGPGGIIVTDESTADDEDDDEDGLRHSRALSRKTRRVAMDGARAGTASSAQDRMSPALRRTRVHKRSPRPAEVPAQQQQQLPWAGKLGLEPRRVAVMQASLFAGADEQPPAVTDLVLPAKPSLTEEPGITKPRTMEPPRKPQADVPTRRRALEPVVPTMPARPFTPRLEPLARSIVSGRDGNLVDQGLAFGRSFGTAWGPPAKLVSPAQVYRSGSSSLSSPGTLRLTTLKSMARSDEDERTRARDLLSLQLERTSIQTSPDGRGPFATTDPTLRFRDFANALSRASAALPADRADELDLFKLGHALFDEIHDLALDKTDDACSPAYERYVEQMRRLDRVSDWLESTVRDSVERDLLRIASSSSSTSSSASAAAQRVFALLSGHQIERACAAAVEGDLLRLATLIAQAGSRHPIAKADDAFRLDVAEQLTRWREYGADVHMASSYRKVLELVAGNTGAVPGVHAHDRASDVEDVHVSQGLDWRRAFGVELWYGRSAGPELDTALRASTYAYTTASRKDTNVAPPLPRYLEDKSYLQPGDADKSTTTWSTKALRSSPRDPAYELVSLYTDATHTLESALSPANFGSSPLDYRLPWHLYTLISRVLRRRDFVDRTSAMPTLMSDEEPDNIANEAMGYSARADYVTVNYATQLESLGLWEWAAFVLLHLEVPELRKKALREIIARNVGSLSDETREASSETWKFLVDKLHIPEAWLYSAQAQVAHYEDDLYECYQLELKAREYGAAHELCVRELVPEAVIQSDFGLVRRLLNPFDVRLVERWRAGAAVFLAYVDLHEKLVPAYVQQQHSALPTGAAVSKDELERVVSELVRSVPALSSWPRAGDKLKVAVSEMQSRLTAIATTLDLSLATARIEPATLQEPDRLVWLQGMNKSFLDSALERAAAV